MKNALTGVWVAFCIGGKRVYRCRGAYGLPADRLVQLAKELADEAREEVQEVITEVENRMNP